MMGGRGNDVNDNCLYLFSASTPKKNYVPIILPNPPTVDDAYDGAIFNPKYPIVDYHKSNLNYDSRTTVYIIYIA